MWNCVESRSYDLKKNLDKTTETELICHPPLGMCDITHAYAWYNVDNVHSYVCDMIHSYVCNDLFICVCCDLGTNIHMCHVTHVRPWFFHMEDMTFTHVWHDTHAYVTERVCIQLMPRPYMRPVSFVCQTWLFHMWNTTHLYVKHDLFVYITRCLCAQLRPHLCGWHDSLLFETWPIYICDSMRAPCWALYICTSTHTNIRIHVHICICMHL